MRKTQFKPISTKYGLASVQLHMYYEDRSTCIRLVSEQDGSPIATLTVCIPGIKLNENEVLVKTWGENEGLAVKALTELGFQDTGKRVSTGFVQAEIWELPEN